MPKFSTTSDLTLGGNKYLKAGDDGWFHMYVVASREGGIKHNGSPLDNAMFQMTCEVVAATKEDCVGKTWDCTIYYPKPGSKDAGAFQGKIVDRFLLAMGVYSLEKLLESQDRDFDADSLTGSQLCVKLRTEKSTDDKEYIGLDGAHVYHPDDPAVADCPKNEEYLKPGILPPARRLTDAQIKKLKEMAKPAKPKLPTSDSVAKGGASVGMI